MAHYQNYERTLQLAFKAKDGKATTCTLVAYGQKVEIKMSSEDFVKLQVAGLFDKEGNSGLFNDHTLTGEL
jgi:translation initiation factor IF-1